MKRELCLTFLMLCVSSLCFAEANISREISKMSVQGKGTVEVQADLFQVNVGVKTIDKTAENALKINSESMNKIEKVISDLGFTKTEFKTNGFSINPVFSPRPRNASSDWQREITGYQVTNAFSIKSQQLKLIGKLIKECTSAGANNISELNFGLSNPYKYRSEAISNAVKNAKQDAEALASAANQKIVKVLNLSLNNFYMPTLRMESNSFAVKSDDASVPFTVNPGMITLTVNVSIVYEIQAGN